MSIQNLQSMLATALAWTPKDPQEALQLAESMAKGFVKSEIIEEVSLDSRCVTVYPCPKCGCPDADSRTYHDGIIEERERIVRLVEGMGHVFASKSGAEAFVEELWNNEDHYND